MPYVEVWIDDRDCTRCDQLEELKTRRDLAFSLLANGDVNAAMDALTKGDMPKGYSVDVETRQQYVAWSKGELIGFAGPASLQNVNTLEEDQG